MSVMEEYMDLFEAYVQGQLSGSEKEEFLQRLKTDEVFKAAFEQYKHQLKVIKALSAGEEMRALMEAEETEEKSARTRWKYWIPMAVAAALILSFFVFGPNKKSTGAELFDKYFEVFPNLISARDNTTDISEALRAYSKADYSTAIELLEAIPTQSDTVIFYQSISHLAENKPEQALEELRSIQSESTFHQPALWYQGLAHLLMNQKDSVGYYLDKVDEDSNYGKDARKILAEFD